MAGGSLLDWLSGTQPAGMGAMSLPWPSRMRVAHQVVEGLVAMAARGSVHGALHPGNILLDGALHAKLVHGSITSLQVDTKSTESEATSNPSVTVIDSPFLSVAEANVPSVKGSWSLGSSAHMDPAGVSGGRPCVASDTYSLGIVLLQLLTGKADAKGLAKEVRRATATVPGLGARLTRLTFTQQEAVAALLDPYAGPWPMQSASALLSLAMACTDSRKRQRPDLKFHVLPCLAALARESAAWPLPTVGSLGSTNVRTASSLSTLTDGIPAVFLCPILREPMSNPVVVGGYECIVFVLTCKHSLDNFLAISIRCVAFPSASVVYLEKDFGLWSLFPMWFSCCFLCHVQASDGYTYERQAIQRWIDKAKSSGMIALSPMTNLPLLHDSIVPVHALRSEISAWMQAQSPTRSQ